MVPDKLPTVRATGKNGGRRGVDNFSRVQFLGFVVTILALTAFAWGIVGSFISGLVPGGWITWMLLWALSVVPLFVVIRNIVTGHYPRALVRLLVFRPFWYSQLLMLALALASGIIALLGLPFGRGAEVGRGVVVIGAVVLIAIGIWGYIGSRRLVVRHLTLAPAGMPASLAGMRIVQLSDLHVGPHTPKAFLARVAAMTRDAKPDLIAYTGDQVDDHPADIDFLARGLGGLTAALGVFAIPGNHDVYAGWSEVRERLETLGVRVLVNEAVRLQHKGAAFWLAGTGDPAGGQFRRGTESGAPDIERTMRLVPRGDFSLVLAHNPALFPALAARGAKVVLSGHTHHGQFSIPSRNWSLASVFLEYAMGTYERNGSLLYVSPGTNYWGIPFRIGALPEVTVITLGIAGSP